MANEPDSTPIHNVYAQRFAADLEINRKEQEDISAQLTELEARLKQLKADEGWLSGMQGTLPTDPASVPAAVPSAVPAAGGDGATVPRPREAKKATGRAAGRKTAQAKKAQVPAPTQAPADAAVEAPIEAPAEAPAPDVAAKTARTAARKSTATATAVKKTPVKKTAGTHGTQAKTVAEPPRRELVLALLVSAAEPRMVSEVAAELARSHPERPASVQVVRNTLEGLAKKGLIEKENKQGSVMYSAPRPEVKEQAPAAAPAADTADEKVPASVEA
ncbi:hypothetical protein OHS33_33940 [Streptomyces sp. NBC_00536]|uniref:hypothetical protein n=1 Tax=Streptomyces sp. NBC_00536 TaxID=2975769 RepID=UPI002E822E39|nr:hypothetical protein [Streptomyces sp. NBC_00536]WUC82930.1 hypothetical protein OHS33_33940 [Streptomyces sp. NBC_00536]